MTKRTSGWTTPQREALAELRRLHANHRDKILEISNPYRSPGWPKAMVVEVCLSMAVIDVPEDDILLGDQEKVILVFDPDFGERPPKVFVDHDRFVDVVHVLYGRNLCVYLNEDREWHPAGGVTDTLEQVWKLFEDAANDRFDAESALFHPIGGLNPATRGVPAAAVRTFPGTPGKPLSLGTIRHRSSARVDLGAPDAFPGEATERTLTICVPHRMRYGPGATLHELLVNITAAGGSARAAILGALQRTVNAAPNTTSVTITIAVARGETPIAGWHLCSGRLPIRPAARPRIVAASTPAEIESALGTSTELEWYTMSDQRPELAVRRDARRPTHALEGREVEVWGCGALGSWIAEILVRAGVSRIWLIDRGGVGAGLLVRQNYLEDDVGYPKATRLKARLEAISDSVAVEAIVGTATENRATGADLIVDATVNEAVAAMLEPPGSGVTAASVATDVESSSLGLLVVGSPTHTPAEVQTILSPRVLERADLEPFHRFWADPEPDDMVLPAPGCSTPTFHGSAADAMGIASTMVNLLGNHLDAETPGMHLINMPHSGVVAPAHLFMEMER